MGFQEDLEARLNAFDAARSSNDRMMAKENLRQFVAAREQENRVAEEQIQTLTKDWQRRSRNSRYANVLLAVCVCLILVITWVNG